MSTSRRNAHLGLAAAGILFLGCISILLGGQAASGTKPTAVSVNAPVAMTINR
jgi:hypothetical protein